MDKVIIYTDGACRGNPGIGSYAAILFYKEHQKLIAEVVEYTTNNQMELLAVIKALETLKRSCTIDLYSDSTYVIKGITQWIIKWRTTNYKNIKNQELWQQLDILNSRHQINWRWVKGHSGNKYNDLVDSAANEAIDKFLACKN